jgi:rhamnulokinase
VEAQRSHSPLRILAVDLGAESGRTMVGSFDGSRLSLDTAHRFANVPVRLAGTLYWDVPRLFGDVLTGIRAAFERGPLASLGVDAWGVDFGLLDTRGQLLGLPVHYRDVRTAGMLERATRRVPREQIYAHTGIQFIPINTLYQLLAMTEVGDVRLQTADRLLMIPDLIHHFLCDSLVGEYTNATTTQCFDVARGAWATELLERLDLPTRIFPEVVPAGTRLGSLRRDVAQDVGASAMVIAPATHDTACAVAATPLPADGNTAFLSSGTWSLVGMEVPRPVLSGAALNGNLTNEGGVAGTIRLLKNVMGLWLVQEARRSMEQTSYEDLAHMAADAPAFTAFVDPDDERFLRPGDLPSHVREFCAETGQTPPVDAPTLVRVLLESLALQYAVVLQQLETASGSRLEAIHVVGGGSHNALLCQLTADASGLPVLAGPAEATSLGNILVQAIALGELASLAEARALVSTSFLPRTFVPSGDWAEARHRFTQVVRSRSQVQGAVS